MSDVDSRIVRQDFPRTEFICALYKMTPEQRAKASAERAAERYGLPVADCQWWIGEARLSNDVWPMRNGGKK